MNINHAVDLNLSASIMPPVLNMAQYDANSRTIVATLWDGTSGFTIPDGAYIMVRFGKPDGTGGLYDETEAGDAITYSGNVVTAPVASQMLSVAGKVQADIEIYQTGETEQAAVKLATFCFVVNVEKAAYQDADIISSDYYNIIAADISEFREAQEQIIASQEQIIEAQAALEEVAENITGTVEAAQAAADAASTSATNAAASAKNAEESATSANDAKTGAETAKAGAESAKNAAAASATAAAAAVTEAKTAVTAAETAKAGAETAKTGAEAAQEAAETAVDNAEAAATEAQNAAAAMQECAPYSADKSYVVGNMVTNGGSTYRCISPCTGIAPPDSTYWLVIAQKGADGSGSGDMSKATYDANNKAQDIFNYADNKAGAVQTNLNTHTNNADIHVTAEEKTAWNNKANSDDIPTQLSELEGDATHRLVTDTEKDTWDNKQSSIDTSGILKGDGSGGVSAAEMGVDYAAPAVTLTVTLSSSGWADGTLTVSVENVTEDSTLVITPAPESYLAYCNAMIRCTGQGDGTLVFTAEEAPTDDLTANVLIL